MPTANTYPAIAAGDDITADLLSSMLPRMIVKPAATARISTGTVTDDPDLSMQVEANAVYIVEFHIYYASIDAAKIKTQWTVPAGVTGNRAVQGPGSTANQANMDNVSMRSGVHLYNTAVTYGTRDSAVNQAFFYEESMLTTSGAGGTLALQWAQGASTATNTTVANGSWMRVTRVG